MLQTFTAVSDLSGINHLANVIGYHAKENLTQSNMTPKVLKVNRFLLKVYEEEK